MFSGDDLGLKHLGVKNLSPCNWPAIEPQEIVPKDCFCAVIDSYQADLEWIEKVAKIAGVTIVFDDQRFPKVTGANIVNAAAPANAQFYAKMPEDCLMLGPAFACLRPEFQITEPPAISDKIRKVLLSAGGGENQALLLKLLFSLERFSSDLEITILSQPLTLSQFKLKSKISVIQTQVTSKLRDIFLTHDLALSAAGQTIWELASLGVPTIAFETAINQRTALDTLSSLKVVWSAGQASQDSFENLLLTGLMELSSPASRANLSKQARSLVDGNGASRIAKHALLKLADNQLKLRPVRASDCRRLFEMSNQPETRANSFSPGLIDWATHSQWFAEKLGDKNFLLLAGTILDTPVCLIRYQQEQNLAVISVNVDRLLSGCGIASRLIESADKMCFEKFPAIDQIKALIKTENLASMKFFLKAGYQQVATPNLGAKNMIEMRRNRF